jgi:hypothetical protein
MFSLLFMALFVVGQAAVAVAILRRMASRLEVSESK